ncbi:hypothetical protein [Candidatus Binatus sp.]|uniref:hypothetical protein n=1 Tax=Candidatus Binatus sp. TaxID=2811406 RepID=UPI003C9A2F38
MKLRHTALALVGWYLMVPPGRLATAFYTPLSQWKVTGIFDSEVACKKTQAAHQGFLYERPPIPSTCIASDDLRLKGK